MRKIISVLLIAMLIFSLCACGQTAAPVATQAPAPADATPAEAAPAPAVDPSSLDAQLNLIYKDIGLLQSSADYQSFWYTITDLDHNGRLEIFAAVTEGIDSVTRGAMYEVNSTFDNLVTVDLGGQYLPEVVVNSADTYRVGDSYSYVYKDTSAVGSSAPYETIAALSMSNAKVTVTPLAYKEVVSDRGITLYDFTDASGNPLNIVDLNDFDNYADTVFTGALKSTTNFDWFAITDVTSVDRLKNSYAVFKGESVVTPAPAPTPQVIYTPQPTMYIVDTNPVITKNPTSETLTEGGSCTFIARADAYQYVAWSLVDQYGNTYGATTTPYGQLVVSGASSPQLTLSNVPLAMNGWSAYATFYGKTNATTTKAYITVNPAPVIVKTVTASPSSGYFQQLSTYVTLYSSTGENIHYEAIKQGDSGAYDSSEIASGSGFYVTGISGQCISVEVYANVVGSDKVAYFVYTVDCEPEPGPGPTPDPGYSSVRGNLGVQETMSTIPILINGIPYSVVLDVITPQGSDLYQGRGCTVYYNGSLDGGIYSVVLDP